MSSPNPVYDAEGELRFMLDNGGKVEAYGSTFTLPIERKFGDLAGVQRYVDLVWEQVLGREAPPKVRARRGSKQAHYEPYRHVIAVPEHRGSNHSWAMREIVILHEIAHAATIREPESHGPLFCAQFLDLLKQCVGPEVSFLMMAALSERGVQISRTMV